MVVGELKAELLKYILPLALPSHCTAQSPVPRQLSMAGSVSLLCGTMQEPFCRDKGLPLDELSIMNYLTMMSVVNHKQ